jgi:hypothetical protein
MALQNGKTDNKPSQHTDSRTPADGSLTLPQRKVAWQKNKPSENKHNKKPPPTQDSWWTIEMIS